MNRRKPTYFRNSLDLRDKVQVKMLRKRLGVSDEQFADLVRKSGNSISAITKEATRATPASVSGSATVAIGDAV
jgi:DNA-binding XRE family transcriptional regulator